MILMLACRSGLPPWPGGAAPTPVPPGSDDVALFILVDRFANGDPTNDVGLDLNVPHGFHGGDLQGVIQHLDPIQDLGVNTVILSPVFEMRTEKLDEWGAYHGYWVEDLRRIAPQFGAVADLRRLSDELHGRDMRLVLDIVYNHAAPDGQLRARHPDWFHQRGGIEDWNDPLEVQQGEVHGLPDFDQTNPEVYRYLLDATLALHQQVGFDGLRLDAVRHMSPAFLRRIGTDLRTEIGSDLWLLGEVFDGNPANVGQASEQASLTAAYDFPFYYAVNESLCDGKPLTTLAATLSADSEYPAGLTLAPFADNHDLPRVRSRCGPNTPEVLLLTLTARGTPVLLYGTDAELEGAEEPGNRADMVFAETPTKGLIQRLTELRRGHPVLGHGRTEVLRVDDDLLAWLRVDEQGSAIVTVNRSGDSAFVRFPDWLRGASPVATVGKLEALEPAGIWVGPGESGVVVFNQGQPTEPLAQRTLRWQATGAPLGGGDVVVATGLGASLGRWDPIAAPRFEDGVLELSFPQGHVAMFKLVVLHPDGSVTWEPGDNRTTVVYPGQAPQEQVLAWR